MYNSPLNSQLNKKCSRKGADLKRSLNHASRARRLTNELTTFLLLALESLLFLGLALFVAIVLFVALF